MTEHDLQAASIDLAHLYSWRVAFFRPALTSKGWRTPVGADGKGWPDCVFVRERVVAVEFKSDVGVLSADQAEWMRAFCDAGVDFYVWRPRDFPAEIVKVLKHVSVSAGSLAFAGADLP